MCLYYYQQVQDVLSAVLSAAQLARSQQVQNALNCQASQQFECIQSNERPLVVGYCVGVWFVVMVGG